MSNHENEKPWEGWQPLIQFSDQTRLPFLKNMPDTTLECEQALEECVRLIAYIDIDLKESEELGESPHGDVAGTPEWWGWQRSIRYKRYCLQIALRCLRARVEKDRIRALRELNEEMERHNKILSRQTNSAKRRVRRVIS